MSRILIRLACAGALAAHAGGCAKDTPDRPVPPGEAGLQAPVQVAGCDDVREGSRCTLVAGGARAITLWWPDESGTPAKITFDTRPAVHKPEAPRSGGLRVRLEVPAGARALQMTLATRDRRVSTFQLTFDEVAEPEALVRARALRKAGDVKKALEILERTKPANAHEAMALASFRARLDLQRGEVDAVIAALTSTSSFWESHGLASRFIRDVIPLSYALISFRQRFDEAAALLERARAAARGNAELLAVVRYNEGGLARQIGDFRTAQHALQEAHGIADRLGLDSDARFALRELAATQRDLGSEQEALQTYQALLTGPFSSPCEQSDLLVFLARTEMALQERRGASVHTDPTGHLERAEASLRGCPDPARLRNVLVEQLLHAVAHGRLPTARRLVARLRTDKGGESPLLSIWRTEGEAKLAMLEGRSGVAAALFSRQAREAAHRGLLEEQFRATVGLGEALEASHKKTQALAALRSAESILDRLVAQIPLGHGAHGFANNHGDSAGRLVDLLLRLDRSEEALKASRLARVRPLWQAAQAHRIAALDEKGKARWRAQVSEYQKLREVEEKETGNWTVTADERRRREQTWRLRLEDRNRILDSAFKLLAGPAPAQRPALREPEAGELLLVYAPSPEGWNAFGKSRTELRVTRVPRAGSGRQAPQAPRALLLPFEGMIARANRVTFVVPDSLWGVDFHELEFRGAPLIAHAPVSFALDLCSEGVCRPEAAQARHLALVVSDPRLDLVEARQERSEVLAALAGDHLRVESLEGRRATFADVRARLPEAWLFHFAGHGESVGREGFTSVLPLAAGSRLMLRDILSLPAAPTRVILSACEGGRIGEDGGLAVAHAFVAAGSRGVLAASRSVEDATARSLARALYRHGIQRPDVAMDQALRAAQLDLARSGSKGWAAFRLIVP